MKLRVRKPSLTGQIAIALLLAVVAGMLLQGQAAFVNGYIKPIGTIFLNLLKFIVVPLVLFSIMAGILSMNDVKKVGRLGLRALLYFMVTTLFAVTLGLVVPSLLKGIVPLIHIDTEAAAEAAEVPRLSVMDQIVNMFPRNIVEPFVNMEMMPVIVIALFFGIAMVHVGEKGELARKVTLSINEVVGKVLGYIMTLAPVGVFCMLTPVVVANGPSVLGSYAALLGLAYLCFAIHAGLVYSSAVRLLGRVSPLKFFKAMQPAMLFAFSSDSSVATLPYTMQSVEKMGVGGGEGDRSFCAFVGCHNQYGRGCHLSWGGLGVYGCLLRCRPDVKPISGHSVLGHGGLHRHTRHSGREPGADGYGVCLGGHPGRMRGRGCRHRPHHRHGTDCNVRHGRRLVRGRDAAAV